MCDTLLRSPDKEEIRATLFTIHLLKSPGPDGFHAYFYQNNWHIVGDDITKFIQTFFLTARIPEDLTQIKLVHIPKVPNPESVSQLRPISLCNTLYKLLTKLLVNRIKPLLPTMHDPPGPIWVCLESTSNGKLHSCSRTSALYSSLKRENQSLGS